MMSRILLTFIILLPLKLSAVDCRNLLGSAPTTGLIIYLERLLENRVIGEAELTRLAAGIEKGQLTNPILEQDALVDSSRLVHRQEIERHISRQNIKLTEVLQWLQKHLKEKARVEAVRTQAQNETSYHFRRMEFHPIEGGEVLIGKERRSVESFELMSTPVTQSHWITIMNNNPSHFTWHESAYIVHINGKEFKAQPDNPVEFVSYEAAQNFVETLNRFPENDPRLYEMIVDHRPGDFYRLPTEEEWVFVASNRGRANTRWFFGDDPTKMSEYAWLKGNSNVVTHPVGELKPLVIDGKKFYDIYGNVDEWIDAEGQFSPRAVGGSVFTDLPDLQYRYLREKGASTGLRLVRIRQP